MTAPQTPEAAPLRVVVIEDNSDYAYLVGEMLNDAFGRDSVTVDSFGSLAEAVGGLDGAACALVDLSLPDSSGLGIIEHVQQAAPALPLVVLTGAEDEEQALRAVELGAQDYLVKRRADPESLRRSIRYAIERKRAEGERAELLHARAAQADAEAISSTLTRLQELADATMPSPGDILDRLTLLKRALAVVSTDAGALLMDRPGGEFEVAAGCGINGLEAGQVISPGGRVRAALDEGTPAVIDELPADAPGPLGPAGGVRSLAVAPLEADGQPIGVLVAAAGVSGRFSPDQAQLLALAAERCARALVTAAAFERERKTSSALQTGLLPQAVPTLRHGEIAVRYLPALDGPAVGGDWYDAIVLPDERLALAVGDVTGHGAEAAVLMGQLRTALRAYALEGRTAGSVVAALNFLALSLGDGAIATLGFVILDPSLATGEYVTAGHPPPVIVSGDGARALDPTGSVPVGVDPAAPFESHPLQLAPGDALCLYSDGLLEDRGVDLRKREAQLAAALGSAAGAEVLCERALAALRPTGAAGDDVALLILRTSTTAHELITTHRAIPTAPSEARAALREWLAAVGATSAESSDIVLAASEAAMNVVEHAYEQADAGEFTVEGYLDRDTVVIIVRDLGRWSEVQARGRGRGLKLMESLMDSVQLSFSAEGTVVVMRRTLERDVPDPPQD